MFSDPCLNMRFQPSDHTHSQPDLFWKTTFFHVVIDARSRDADDLGYFVDAEYPVCGVQVRPKVWCDFGLPGSCFAIAIGMCCHCPLPSISVQRSPVRSKYHTSYIYSKYIVNAVFH